MFSQSYVYKPSASSGEPKRRRAPGVPLPESELSPNMKLKELPGEVGFGCLELALLDDVSTHMENVKRSLWTSAVLEGDECVNAVLPSEGEVLLERAVVTAESFLLTSEA